jgi:hypothetical protein
MVPPLPFRQIDVVLIPARLHPLTAPLRLHMAEDHPDLGIRQMRMVPMDKVKVRMAQGGTKVDGGLAPGTRLARAGSKQAGAGVILVNGHHDERRSGIKLVCRGHRARVRIRLRSEFRLTSHFTALFLWQIGLGSRIWTGAISSVFAYQQAKRDKRFLSRSCHL